MTQFIVRSVMLCHISNLLRWHATKCFKKTRFYIGVVKISGEITHWFIDSCSHGESNVLSTFDRTAIICRHIILEVSNFITAFPTEIGSASSLPWPYVNIRVNKNFLWELCSLIYNPIFFMMNEADFCLSFWSDCLYKHVAINM